MIGLILRGTIFRPSPVYLFDSRRRTGAELFDLGAISAFIDDKYSLLLAEETYASSCSSSRASGNESEAKHYRTNGRTDGAGPD